MVISCKDKVLNINPHSLESVKKVTGQYITSVSKETLKGRLLGFIIRFPCLILQEGHTKPVTH